MSDTEDEINHLIHQFLHISTDRQTESNQPNLPIPPTVNELEERLNRLRNE